MYILMIARGYPTKAYPQWGCFEKDQAEALQRNGNKVVVVSIDSRFLWRFRRVGVSHFEVNGVVYYNSFWIPGKILSLIGGVKLSMRFKELQLDLLYKKILSKYGKPDVVYGQFFGNTAMGVFLKKKYHIPLVGIEHAARFNQDKLDSYTKRFATYAYENVDALIAVSKTLKDRLYYHFHKYAFVVHNLVDSCFENAKVNENKERTFQFVSTATLEYRKGFDVLIKAFGILKNDNARLVIIGDGPEKSNLHKLISDCNLEDKVFLVGQKTKQEIVNILCESNAFVLPSRSENFSVAVLEALAVGLPVVATICGGIRECINERNGILVPVEDVDALSVALKEMYFDYSHFDSEYIVADYENRFSSSVIAKQLTNIFETVIAK